MTTNDNNSALARSSAVPSCDPEMTLLAWAKDERYIHYMQSLLRDILGSDDDATTWYVGAMLTILVLVGSNGRTRGMEACRLMYNCVSKRRSRLILSMMIASTTRYYLQRSSRGPAAGTTTAITVRVQNSPTVDFSTTANHNLRGQARRRFHEQQRQAMLQRAADASTMAFTNTTPPTSSSLPVGFVTKWGRIRLLFLEMAKSLGQSLAMPREGPHALPQASQQQLATAPLSSTIGTWLIRLFLAYYCFYGRYPNWMHQPVDSSSHLAPASKRIGSSSTMTTNKPPTTMQLVAWFIAMQAVSTFFQEVSRLAMRWWIIPQLQSPKLVLTNGDDAFAAVNQVMGISSPVPAHQDNHAQPRTSQQATETSDISNKEVDNKSWWCGICRMPCKSSSSSLPLAAPISCGHVFCWDCLMQWLCPIPSTTTATTSSATMSSFSGRSECPLCRSPCTPQQVMALYF